MGEKLRLPLTLSGQLTPSKYVSHDALDRQQERSRHPGLHDRPLSRERQRDLAGPSARFRQYASSNKPSSSTLQHAVQHILVPIKLTPSVPIVVVHFCTSTAAARLELPLVLSGHQVSNPQTTLGSNTKRGASPRKPAAIFVGAGFEREDYEAFRGDVGDGHGLAWIREERSDVEGLDDPDNWMVREGIGRVPRPEVLVRSVSKVLGRELFGAR